MIEMKENIIHICTANTSYILSTQSGQLENLYYGARIALDNPLVLQNKDTAGYGCEVKYRPDMPSLASLLLDISGVQQGEMRRAALALQMPHGGYTSQYSFAITTLQKQGEAPHGGMPFARKPNEVLRVTMAEADGLTVDVYYSVFYDADVITRRYRITNNNAKTATITRALSYQLDLPRCDYTLYTLNGAWAREAGLTAHSLAQGSVCFGSNTGTSSNFCNPFFFLAQQRASESYGEVYGFNLIYSGSHEASVEVDHLGRMRIMAGISSDNFAWELPAGEAFVTPEAVLTFSNKGTNGMSQNMHAFINHHIVPPRWRKRQRPVLCNNWEGTYFDFDETKLLAMAREAAKAGVELFVLDDGWFGQRDNDKAGLGDYNVNYAKLPGGLQGLAENINSLGMQFGLWFEPEMVNANSDLYRAHPNWIVKTPGYEPCQGRNQYVLDITREKVRSYIIRSMNEVLDSARISYVKWDMNRNLTDNYSLELTGRQGEFGHRYTLGLYALFEGICKVHPEILFEGCASGGNRFDLGILYYMPQIWASDCTDALQRQKIQTGLSYGYPLSTMGCHVSDVPNHQTLRDTPLETRFNTAMFGVLGYELDFTLLSERERKDIAVQISYYKKHRALLQYGIFYRLEDAANGYRWLVVSQKQDEAIVGDFTTLVTPNASTPPLRLTGLDEAALYDVQARRQKIRLKHFGGLVNHVLPFTINPKGRMLRMADRTYRITTENENYTAYGSLLHHAGIVRWQQFSGAGYKEQMRFLLDFDSRVYYLQQVKLEECAQEE